MCRRYCTHKRIYSTARHDSLPITQLDFLSHFWSLSFMRQEPPKPTRTLNIHKHVPFKAPRISLMVVFCSKYVPGHIISEKWTHPWDATPVTCQAPFKHNTYTLVLDEYECVVSINSNCSLESPHVLLFHNVEPQIISFDLFDTENVLLCESYSRAFMILFCLLASTQFVWTGKRHETFSFIFGLKLN